MRKWPSASSSFLMWGDVRTARIVPYHRTTLPVSGAGKWVNIDLLAFRLDALAQATHEWAGLLEYWTIGWSGELVPAPS